VFLESDCRFGNLLSHHCSHSKKKADANAHVGLLINGPPGDAEMPFA
jgi:hypothetical protein